MFQGTSLTGDSLGPLALYVVNWSSVGTVRTIRHRLTVYSDGTTSEIVTTEPSGSGETTTQQVFHRPRSKQVPARYIEVAPQPKVDARLTRLRNWSWEALCSARIAHRRARPRRPPTARVGSREAFSGSVGAIHGRWRVRQ